MEEGTKSLVIGLPRLSVVASSPISNLKCISIHEDFVLANSVEPDEMPHFVAFHQDCHCLPK